MTFSRLLRRALLRKLIPFTLGAVWMVSVYEMPGLLGLNSFQTP